MKHILCGMALLAALTTISCRSTTAGMTRTVHIIHDSTGNGDVPSVALSHGDRLEVHVENTRTECFDYNVRDIRPEAIARGTTKILEANHDEATTAYEVVVRRRAGATGCDDLPERSWRIPVRQLWNVAFTGGVARHDLTDQEFYLEPGKSTEATPRDGFRVKEDTDAQNDFSIAGTALSHLYLSAPSIAGVALAPLTFGITLDEQPSYLLGTGVRLGTRAFLTAGRIFGTQHRLPTGVAVDHFTTEPNFLDDLPSKNTEGWFVSISLSFLDRGVSTLLQNKIGIPVPTTQQAAARATNPTPTTTPTPAIPLLRLDRETAVAGDRITITGSGFGGTRVPESLLRFPQVNITSNQEAEIPVWRDDRIEFVFPAIPQDANSDQAITFEVVVNGRAVGQGTLTIPRRTN